MQVVCVKQSTAAKFPSDQKKTKESIGFVQDIDILLKKSILDSIVFSKDAVALSLLDILMIEVAHDGQTKKTHRSVVKVIGQKGKDIVTPNIIYNKGRQVVKIQHAKVINQDNSVTYFTDKKIEQDAIVQNDMFVDIRYIKLLPPKLDIGSIIDYQYEVREKKPLIPGHFSTEWLPAKGIPSIESAFILAAPRDMPLYFFTPGGTKPEHIPGNQWISYFWRRMALPPVDIEPQMQFDREKMGWVGITTMHGWDAITSWYWRLLESRMHNKKRSMLLADSLVKNCTSSTDSTEAIFDWVLNNIRYVSISLGTGAYEPRTPDEVITTKYGDCKDKAVLLLAMLGHIGVNACPVLVRPKPLGPVIEEIPGISEFSHMIVAVENEGDYIWADATAEHYKIGTLPLAEQGTRALLFDRDKFFFVTLPHASKENGGYEREPRITRGENEWTFTSRTKRYGSDASEYRSFYAQMGKRDLKKYMETVTADFSPLAELDSFSIKGVDEDGDTVVTSNCFRIKDKAAQQNELFINPAIMEATNLSEHLKLFAAKAREYALITGTAGTYKAEYIVSLPNGYHVINLPEDMNISSPISCFEARWRKDIGLLTGKMTISHGNDCIDKSYYNDEKEFMQKVVTYLNRDIILKKK